VCAPPDELHRFRHGIGDCTRLSPVGEWHKPDSKSLGAPRGFNGKSGLARAARAREGDQPRGGVPQQHLQALQFLLSAKKALDRRRQARRGQ
jgi:hypothetical protein